MGFEREREVGCPAVPLRPVMDHGLDQDVWPIQSRVGDLPGLVHDRGLLTQDAGLTKPNPDLPEREQHKQGVGPLGAVEETHRPFVPQILAFLLAAALLIAAYEVGETGGRGRMAVGLLLGALAPVSALLGLALIDAWNKGLL